MRTWRQLIRRDVVGGFKCLATGALFCWWFHRLGLTWAAWVAAAAFAALAAWEFVTAYVWYRHVCRKGWDLDS